MRKMTASIKYWIKTLGIRRRKRTTAYATTVRPLKARLLFVSLAISLAPQVFAAPPLYDRFGGEYLDASKWRPGSFSTNIESGYFEIARGTLNMGMRAYADLDGALGGADQAWSNLWLAEAKSLTVREIQSRIRVRELSADACNRNTAAVSYAEIQQRAFWFNDGTTRPGSTNDVGIGDVYTNLSISQSSRANDRMNVYANVFHVTNTGTDRIFSTWLGTIRNSGRPITLRTSWLKSRNQFHFLKYVPGEGQRRAVFTYSPTVRAVSRPAWRFNGKGLTLRAFPAYCRKLPIFADIHAVIEEIRVR